MNLLDDNETILAFAFTNEKGEFTLTLPAAGASSPLWLQASYIGHRNQRILLLPGEPVYHFNLATDAAVLKEVVINNKPSIEKMGDTLRYEVGKFSQKEDRTIGDVLKRMPGIEVADDGTISFNGKKISNLYIHGDDLMSGKYGSATRAIKKEMIVSVDIMMNHQPIKVLKNKIRTDNTALNLVLKDEKNLKWSFKGTAGAGWPRLYDASATAVLMNSRYKALNNIALNNSGVSYTDDFKQLGTANFTSGINSTPPKIDLSLGTIGPPDLPLPNYYFNNSRLINLNNLYKTQSDVQLKVNVQAFIDRNSLDYYSRTDTYLPNDTIYYREQQSFTKRPSLLHTTFNVTVNKERYFFNNQCKFELSNEDNTSFMKFNDYLFNQAVNKNIKSFSNDINWMPALPGRGIGELRWLISYSRDRQSLNIGNGYNFQIPAQEGYYENVIQNLRLPSLFSNLYWGYKLAGDIVTQSYTAGAIIESQDFNSQLELLKNGTATAYTGDAGNNLHWYISNMYITPEYQVRYKRLRSTIRMPVSYQNIRYSQQEYGLDTKHRKLLFTPSVNIRYEVNSEQYLDAGYSLNNNLSNITGMYRGGILTNYRSFNANDAGLQQRVTHLFSANYYFEKAVNMLFSNAGISFDNTTTNAMLTTVILNNVQKTVFLPYRNTQYRWSLNTSFSKFIFALKTTASLKLSWNRFRNTGIVNGTFQPLYSEALLFSGKIMKKMFSAVTLTYEPKGIRGTSWSGYTENGKSRSKNHTFRLDQHMTLGLMPMKQMNVSATARYSFSNKSNSNGVRYFFMDAKATYTQKRMDLIFSVNNMFNVTHYALFSLTPYQLMADEYHIRGRMVMLRLHYYF
ncbi:hypothetical protein A4R26_20865 [Niastella populi]|uniref:Outer membrane protein beta-barrel domain-containing protein n=1 Tax=Niastella populi TaxID=550983 RepID=A0A1V9FNC0_9BACT|nr:hypothetical protein A4R26_20865 [Niastella populi]